MFRSFRVWMILCLALLCVYGQCAAQASQTNFQTYKDIPGITNEEIDAVEKLKLTYSRFTYGVNITSEAFIMQDGTVGGFALLLCKRLSTLFGISFTPQAYDWDALNEKLTTKEIDFTGELSPTPERQQRLFMTGPIYQRTLRIFSVKGRDSLEEIAEQRPIRCAFLRGSTTYDFVKKSWTLPFEAKFIETEKEAPLLLKRGAIDAYIDESSVEAIFDSLDSIHAADYFPIYYSPLSLSTANQDFKPIISVIQKYLRNGGFDEIENLYFIGLKQYAEHRLFTFFTAEEKEYIRQHNTPQTAIRTGMESDNYPMSFYNVKLNEYQGISVDVLQQVTRYTGLKFAFVNSPDVMWPELLKQLENGEISLVSELVPSKLRQGRFLWTSSPYSIDRFALLSRSSFPDVDVNKIVYTKIGLIKDSVAAELFAEWFPGSVSVKTYIDYMEAFEALERGEVDLLMATESLLLTLTNYLEKTDFKVNITFQQSAHSFFGLYKKELLLQSILNKTQQFIKTDEISSAWKRKVFDYKRKIFNDALPYIVASILLLLVGFAAVIYLLVKNRKMSKGLEALVIQRTSELEHASRAKSDFLSSMSHEMRTPMNVIIGMTKIAERSVDIAKLRYCLATIGASSTHLLALINNILDMSKIEAGKLELDEAPFNIEDMLIKTSGLIVDKAEQKSLLLSMIIAPGMHLDFIGDELKLTQVITNLVSNAVKFTPDEGKVVVTAEEKQVNAGTSLLRFTISDTGIGMTQEQIGNLFTLFTQADKTIASKFGGTGLGLAISKSIIEKMNGKIWVESTVGEGSNFIIELELTQVNSASEDDPALVITHGAQVLVAEQKTEIANQLCSILTQQGIGCQQAYDDEELVRLLAQAQLAGTPYDAIFIGYKLYLISGAAITSQFGKAINDSIAIIASFSEWNSMEPLAKEQGMTRMLAKPLFPSLVVKALQGIITGGGEQASTPATELYDAPDFSHISLLLVDDVELNREILLTLLEETGMRVETAENGQEAVLKYAAAPDSFDVIVMDIQMPVMNGYEATKAIRVMGKPNSKTIPIIALTANAFKEDIEKCLASGMNDHLVKPIDELALFEKLENLMGKRT